MAKNQLLNQGASKVMDVMKQEIAAEMGVVLDGSTPSRLNGAVGGEMVKRLIAIAEAGLMDEAQKVADNVR